MSCYNRPSYTKVSADYSYLATFFRLQRTIDSTLIFFFFFNDTATTEIYTLSLHDALPICWYARGSTAIPASDRNGPAPERKDRKSTRLNSSHMSISYAVFCLKKKKTIQAKLEVAAVAIGCATVPSAFFIQTAFLPAITCML